MVHGVCDYTHTGCPAWIIQNKTSILLQLNEMKSDQHKKFTPTICTEYIDVHCLTLQSSQYYNICVFLSTNSPAFSLTAATEATVP